MAKRREKREDRRVTRRKRILEDFYEHFNYLKQVGIEGLRGNADEDANVTREEKNNKEEQKGMKGALAMAMSFALPVLPTPPTFGKKVTPGGAYSPTRLEEPQDHRRRLRLLMKKVTELN